MPSQTYHDSVDRILEDMNMQQGAGRSAGQRHRPQVDEILRSVGILSLPDEPLPEDTLAFPEGDALDDLLQKPVSQPAPAPAQPRPHTPVQQPDPAAGAARRADDPPAGAAAADGGQDRHADFQRGHYRHRHHQGLSR